MSQDVEQFRQQLGLLPDDFAEFDELSNNLLANTKYHQLREYLPYLCGVALSGEGQLFQIDKYDTKDNTSVDVLVAPTHLYGSSTDAITDNTSVRITLNRDNLAEEVAERRLQCADFIIDPTAVGLGIHQSYQLIKAFQATNKEIYWQTTMSDAPKISRIKDGSDRKLGPASVELYVGSVYETHLRRHNTFMGHSKESVSKLYRVLDLIRFHDAMSVANLQIIVKK